MSKKKKKQQNVEPKAEPEQKKPFIKGRTFRAYIGFAIIIVDLAVFFDEHILKGQDYELMQLAGHALFIGLGLLLIDRKLFSEFLAAVSNKFKK